MTKNIPQEILDQLSPEELEGMMDEDLAEEGEPDGTDGVDEAEPEAAEAADNNDGPGDEDAAVAAATAEADAASAAGEDAAAAGDTPPAEIEHDPEDVTPAWVLPINVKEQIDTLKAERNELAQKWDDGELTATEHRKLADELEDRLDSLKAKQMAADVGRETAVQKWAREDVPSFLNKNPEYKRSEFMLKALEAKVVEIQKTSRNPVNPKILERAHAEIRREIYGDDAAKPAKASEGQQANGKPSGKPGAPKRPDMPPTLRGVSQSDAIEAGGGGEFGYLDRLMDSDSVAFEQALSKLSETQRDRYLAQG